MYAIAVHRSFLVMVVFFAGQNISMSGKLSKAATAMGTDHGAEVCVKRNISMSFKTQKETVLVGTVYRAEVCLKRNISMSVKLQ
jgi:hypothetical protein